jgi:hypothetical protein
VKGQRSRVDRYQGQGRFLGHTSIEFIAIANPFQASPGEVIQSDQVVVSGESMDTSYTHLVESDEEVLGDIDWTLERQSSDIGRGFSAQRSRSHFEDGWMDWESGRVGELQSWRVGEFPASV